MDGFGNLQWFDYWRLFNAGVGFFLLWRVSIQAKRNWSNYTDKMKDYTFVLLGMTFLIAEAALEAVLIDAAYKNTTILVTGLLVLLWRAVRTRGPFVKGEV